MTTKSKSAVAIATLVVLALGVLVYEIWEDFGASSVESMTAIPVNPTVPDTATMGANGYTAEIVDALPGGEELTDEQFKKAWVDVNSADAIAANSAVWRMIAAGDSSVQKLKGRICRGCGGFR
jgi:hypothetical protein